MLQLDRCIPCGTPSLASHRGPPLNEVTGLVPVRVRARARVRARVTGLLALQWRHDGVTMASRACCDCHSAAATALTGVDGTGVDGLQRKWN